MTGQQLVNLTPHAINVIDHKGETIAVIPPSGDPSRLEMERRQIGEVWVDGSFVPLNHSALGGLSGLPPPAPGVKYIVSRMVAEAVIGTRRTDILIPDDTVRDGGGRIIGCRAFATLFWEED